MKFVIAIIVIIVVGVIRAIIESSGERKQQKLIQQEIDRGLRIRLESDIFQPEPDAPPLPITEVAVSGAIFVPRDNYRAAIRARLVDITESREDPYPILCQISELADENGIFSFDEPATIPHAFSKVTGMTIMSIPLFALMGPSRGPRRVELTVAVTAEQNIDRIYAIGTKVFDFDQEQLGYIDIEKQTKKHERQIANLALAMSAADGSIDKRELAVIRKFFTERLEGAHEETERKQRITKILQTTLEELKTGKTKADALITQVCSELTSEDDATAAQVAYELCVQVVAGDEEVDPREQKALDFIARRLNIPDEFKREVQDRNLRISMYDEAADENLIDMPPGLSLEEKRNFLNQEYRKWRGRVTHSDPEVAAEATIRLERITRMRRELEDVQE